MHQLVGYIPGVWDLLHIGHLIVLENARGKCRTLIVGVPSDEIVKEDKGELPIISLNDRLRMLNALVCVEEAVPYYYLSFLDHLNAFDPDVLFVGETWGSAQRHQKAESWVRNHGKQLIQLPYYRRESTTLIKSRIIEDNNHGKGSLSDGS